MGLANNFIIPCKWGKFDGIDCQRFELGIDCKWEITYNINICVENVFSLLNRISKHSHIIVPEVYTIEEEKTLLLSMAWLQVADIMRERVNRNRDTFSHYRHIKQRTKLVV